MTFTQSKWYWKDTSTLGWLLGDWGIQICYRFWAFEVQDTSSRLTGVRACAHYFDEQLEVVNSLNHRGSLITSGMCIGRGGGAQITSHGSRSIFREPTTLTAWPRKCARCHNSFLSLWMQSDCVHSKALLDFRMNIGRAMVNRVAVRCVQTVFHWIR